MKKYKVQYSGLNCSSFINYLIKNDIEIESVEKGVKDLSFSIDYYNYRKLKKCKSPYRIKIIKDGGIKSIFNTILKRIGILIGIVVVVVAQLVMGDRVVYINVLGGSNQQQIKDAINEYGVKNISSLDKEDLEKYLVEKLNNLSLVSVKTSGNAIIVNVFEKDDSNEEYEHFYAPYNMVINSIELISGTVCINNNNVVKKGDVLVEAYTISANGDKISVPAKAKITADVWFCGSEIAYKESVVYEKTGNKKEYSDLSFKTAKGGDYVSPYDSFVVETYSVNLTNGYFLPLFLNKTIYYETTKVVKVFDFEKTKAELFEKSKQKAYDILPNNVTINEEIQRVSELDDRYIFQTYLKSTMEIKNED